VRWDYGEAKGIYFSSGVSPNVSITERADSLTAFASIQTEFRIRSHFQDADFDPQFVCRENKQVTI